MPHLSALFSKRIQGTQSSAVRELLKHSKTPDMISLAGGIPAADLFDMEGINAALDIAASEGVTAYQYSTTDGESTLREEVVRLLQDRGIQATAEEVLITSGSQQGLDLVARVLLDKDDVVLLERPTYLAALQVFGLCEARLQDVVGDEQGIDPAAVEAALQQQPIKLLYVVPNFANPTGSTLSLARRQKLLELAVQYNFLIVEDDPYGQIRFDDHHLPSLYQLSFNIPGAAGRVVYLSSFSKILVPGLRVGFMVAQSTLREPLVIAKQAFDLHTPVLNQRIVAAYLQSGRLKQRLPILCEQYEKRCDSLMTALSSALGDQLQFSKPAGGMFLWGRLAEGVSAEELLPFAVAQKVVFVPGSAFYVSEADPRSIRLSFVTISEAQAQDAAQRLQRALLAYQA